MSLFAAIGTGLALAVRYVPVALGIATKVYELIKNIRDDSNPVDTLGQSTLDDIQHIRDICSRTATLLGTSLPPLPDVSAPDDLTGFFSVAVQYAQAYYQWANENLAAPAIQVRAALMPNTDDFSGDELRAGGISTQSAASLTGTDLTAYQNLSTSLQSWIQVFPTRSMASRSVIPDYADINEYIPGSYDLLQRKCFADYVEKAVDGLGELAVGGVIVPVNGFTTTSRYTWEMGTEGAGGYTALIARTPSGGASGKITCAAVANQPQFKMTFAIGATLVDYLIFTPAAVSGLDFDIIAASQGLTYSDSTSWQCTLGLGSEAPTDAPYPPKLGLYHWMVPVTAVVNVASGADTTNFKGLAFRFGSKFNDLADQNFTAKYFIDTTTAGPGNYQVEFAIDMWWLETDPPTATKAITVLPCGVAGYALTSAVTVTFTVGTPFGVLERTGLNASDVTYQNSSNQFVSITNDTTFFDLLGQVSSDDIHDDPNASVQALFLQRFGGAAQALASALGAYATYAQAYGINVDAKYLSVFGLHLKDVVDMMRWLDVDGPFAGLTSLQKKQLLYKLMYDLGTYGSYAPYSSGMSTATIALAEPTPGISVSSV